MEKNIKHITVNYNQYLITVNNYTNMSIIWLVSPCDTYETKRTKTIRSGTVNISTLKVESIYSWAIFGVLLYIPFNHISSNEIIEEILNLSLQDAVANEASMSNLSLKVWDEMTITGIQLTTV